MSFTEAKIFFKDNKEVLALISLTEQKLTTQKSVIIALDGRSGSGKTTLAKSLARLLNGVEIHADDFWTGGSNDVWDARTPKERADLAIDWKRIRDEVLTPLRNGNQAKWHPFDFVKNEGLVKDPVIREAAPIVFLDGAYSARPELGDLVDIRVLIKVADNFDRKKRLVAREGQEYMDDWHSRWDLAEDYYFEQVMPEQNFDLIITT